MDEKSPGKSLQGVAADPSLRGRGPRKGAPNAGRPPSAVAASARLAWDKRIRLLERIADGKPLPYVRRVEQEDGTWKTIRVRESATAAERIKALDQLGKFGGLAALAVTGQDGVPLPMGPAPTPELVLEKLLKHAKGEA